MQEFETLQKDSSCRHRLRHDGTEPSSAQAVAGIPASNGGNRVFPQSV